MAFFNKLLVKNSISVFAKRYFEGIPSEVVFIHFEDRDLLALILQKFSLGPRLNIHSSSEKQEKQIAILDPISLQSIEENMHIC